MGLERLFLIRVDMCYIIIWQILEDFLYFL